MTAHSGSRRDPEAAALEVRRREIVAHLRELVGPELIGEHRRRPRGRHSPALALVLAYLGQAPVEGKLVAHCGGPGRRWRVLRLSGVQGEPARAAGDASFDTEEAVAHQIFLQRLVESGLATAPAGGGG